MPAGDPPLSLRRPPRHRIATSRVSDPRSKARLADMGLHNVLDLLQHYPRRWIDRTKRVDIAVARSG